MGNMTSLGRRWSDLKGASDVRPLLAPLLTGALLVGLAMALMLAGATVARPGVTVEAGDPRAGRTLVRFYGVEQNASDTYRWSEPLAGVFLYGYEGRPAMVSLRLAAPRPPGVAPALTLARSGGVEPGAFTVTGDWRRYHLLAPTSASGESALLLTTPAFTPAGDPRELGLALSAARVAPLGDAGLAPVRTLYLLALPLLGWLALRRLGAPAAAAVGSGIALAAVAGWAAASPTAAGYWLPTLGWPLWPAVPLLLLLFWPRIGAALTATGAWARARPGVGWAGLALGLAALCLIRVGLPWPLGMTLVVVGSWLGTTLAPDPAHHAKAGHVRAWQLAGGLLFLALFLRLYQLGEQPAGLWRDESRHGLQALQIWSDPGYRPIYVVEGADLPALLFYLMAPVVGLFGPEAWSARLVSALAGALTPLALYWAAGPLIGRRAALFAAALLAWASWSLSMSRWAFPATLDHLLVLTAVGLVWRCLGDRPPTTDHQPPATDARLPDDRLRRADEHLPDDRRRAVQPAAKRSEPEHVGRRWGGGTADRRRLAVGLAAERRWSVVAGLASIGGMALAGFLGGLAVYAYHTGRVAPLALAAVAALRLGPRPAAWRRAAPGLAAAALVGALTVAPLAAYILGDLDGYNRRVGSVALLDSNDPTVHSPLGLTLSNLGRYALAFHVAGDQNGRHHMPGAPLLDPVAGLLLALGLALALRAARRSPGLAAVLALGAVYLIPGVFSGNAPHAMRSLGTLAPAMLLAGVGLAALLEAQSAQRKTQSPLSPPAQRPSRSPLALAAAVLAASLAFNGWIYFGAMRVEPTVYGEFDLLETTMGRVAQAPARAVDPALQAVRVYLPEQQRSEDTVRFLTWGLTVGAYSGAPLPADGPALVILPASATAAEQAEALAALGPGAAALGPTALYPGTGAPVALAFGRGEAAARLLASLCDFPRACHAVCCTLPDATSSWEGAALPDPPCFHKTQRAARCS